MFGNVPLLGYIENTGDAEPITPEKVKREINDDNTNNNNTNNSTTNSPTIKKTQSNNIPFNNNNNNNNNNKSYVEESPISIRSVSSIASSPYADVSHLFAGFNDGNHEYNYEWESNSDDHYYTADEYSEGSNGLTEEDFSNISSFLDEQQASMPSYETSNTAEDINNEVIVASQSLKDFNLKHISSFNFNIFSSSLFSLDLSHNELSFISDEIRQLSSLSQLLLWNNTIEKIDPAIGDLHHLRVMDLNHNLLTHLPTEINQLTNLTQLHLVNNKFSHFPSIFQLHSLHALHLEMNNIDHIPSQIGKLTSLHVLNMNNNIIEHVPQELFFLPVLKELRLSHNKLSSIPEDIQLTRLKTLSLDHNEISSLPSSLFCLSSLFFLDASHNKLSCLPEDMSSLYSLVSLNVNNNSISSIPSTIGSLTSIEYLMLYNNNLTSLPFELVNCGQLRDLGLGGNELPSIYNLGMSAVLSTLREAHHSNPSSPPVLHDWEINFHELEFGNIIGEGAFGQVFQGRWREKDVAIKQLTAGKLLKEIEETEREKTMKEFRREVGMLSRLKPHQHLVRYFGACTQPPNLYIITEYIPRGSLHELLHESYMEINATLKLKLAKGAALACHCLTSNDPPVYHCDLKAKNLLITLDWNVKLGDFGQSTFDRSPNGGIGDWTYVKFAAPEILLKAPHCEKSEVYSFGVILWELITRTIPFKDQEPEYVREFIQNGGRLEIPPDCPPSYRQLIIDCWQDDPAMRPSFMEIYIRLQNMELFV